MTFRRFKRLLLVLLAPLLAIGFLMAKLVYPYPDLHTFMCEQRSTTEDWCRATGELGGPFFDRMKSTQPAWFDIQPQTSDRYWSHQLMFMGSRRIIANAHITSAQPYAGSRPDAAAAMKALVGRTAIVSLGIADNQRSYVSGTSGLVGLYCNNVSLENAPASYEAGCYGEGWSGTVQFTARGADEAMLDGLRNEVEARRREQRNEYLLFQIVTYPLLLYAFLLLSAVAWLIARAVRYIRSAEGA